MNVCRPDSRKSCAACCGLYNVPDATRSALEAKLERRTLAFRRVTRTPQAIEDYRDWVRANEPDPPLDDVIHVCEFTGFLDPLHRIVGCQLHPTAPNNEGVDLRGLCHYGSMACKSFFCPAWEETPPRLGDLVSALVDDWHVYGLVMTDVDFTRSVFALLEQNTEGELELSILRSSGAATILTRMLSWKDSWPFGGGSLLRRNRYYFKGLTSNPQSPEDIILECLGFTFGQDPDVNGARRFVRQAVEDFVQVYESRHNTTRPPFS